MLCILHPCQHRAAAAFWYPAMPPPAPKHTYSSGRGPAAPRTRGTHTAWGGPRSSSRLQPPTLGTNIAGWLWLLGLFFVYIYTNKGTKCTKVFGRGWRGWPILPWRAGAGHGLPSHLVVVAHHPLDVEEFVAQGFGLQLLRLVVGALKGSTWAMGRGLQLGGGTVSNSPLPSCIAPTQPHLSWNGGDRPPYPHSPALGPSACCTPQRRPVKGTGGGSPPAGTMAGVHEGGCPTGMSRDLHSQHP